MTRTAILVDGGYYRKRISHITGHKSPCDRAKELHEYCKFHVSDSHCHLYRIFYYDCPPLDKVIYHPLLKKQIDFKKSDTYSWTIEFFEQLKRQRKFALRMGKLEERDTSCYRIKQASMKKLLNGKLTLEELTESDFEIDFGQKGVDMRIGLDIASLAHKRLVDQIVLISGDSDFVPAAKYARREGIDFVLDAMGHKVNADLFEHIDGMQSYWRRLANTEYFSKHQISTVESNDSN